jgi:hypothetical protein
MIGPNNVQRDTAFGKAISGEVMEKSVGMHRLPDPNRKAA